MRFNPKTARLTKRRIVPAAQIHRAYGRTQAYDSTSNTWVWLAMMQQQHPDVECRAELLVDVPYAPSAPVYESPAAGGGDYAGAGASGRWDSSPALSEPSYSSPSYSSSGDSGSSYSRSSDSGSSSSD